MSKKSLSTLTAFFAMIPIWIIAGVISFSLSECTNKEKPIPRRTAYPRVNLCDTVYVKSPLLPVNFEINAEAIASEDDSNNTNDGRKWINVFYSKYNETRYYTYKTVTFNLELNEGENTVSLSNNGAYDFNGSVPVTPRIKAITVNQAVSGDSNE